MKNNFFFFTGLFAALLISWLGIVIGSNAQLGSLPPYYDDNDGSSHPEWLAGVAAEGQLVYKGLGCVACHTQQVRRPGFGSDQARGWGDRQSVARDYIYQPFPQLGLSRTGPDLTNVGARKVAYDRDDFLHLLYTGAPGMPSYRFLFEPRRIGADAQPSDDALKLTGALKPPSGWEVVPTRKAEALVGYLLNLKTTYTYPEAVPFVAEKTEGEAKPTPAASAPTPAAPAAAMPAPSATPSPTAGQAAVATPAPTETQVPGPTPTPTVTTTPAPSSAAAVTPAPSATSSGAPVPTAAPTEASPAPASGATPTPTSAGPAAAVTPTPSTTPVSAVEATPTPTTNAGGTK